jgi:hypothetical protein
MGDALPRLAFGGRAGYSSGSDAIPQLKSHNPLSSPFTALYSRSMSDREICGVCRGSWPCECSPHAASVVMMESVDDDFATRMAARMGADRNAPLLEKPYDPPIRDVTWRRDPTNEFCGHYIHNYDLDTDKRIVSCRNCQTALDPYEVLARLVLIDRRVDDRLLDLRELEKMERGREVAKKARAHVRRHRYAPMSRRGQPEFCATCDGAATDDVHAIKRPRSFCVS